MAFPTVKVTQPATGTTVNTLPNAGQTTKSESLPVTLASDQGALAVTGSFWQTTQPVSGSVTASFSSAQHVIVDSMPGGGSSVDVTDRDARLLGHVIIDNASIAVTGSFGAPDVTDRSGRLLGHVSVDNSSLAVTGTFWQATQPISGTVAVSNLPATQPVSGTFWQATQPVSIATNTPDVTDRAARLLGHVTVDNASLAVTGAFWQATQPISGSVSVSNLPATQPVSGTFWQATQPVSIASMPSTPVTGTFWQATQPVSLATNTPDVTDRSARLLGHVTVDNASLAVTGTFWQATQPVSGTVTANAGTNLNTSALALDATITGGTQTTRLTDGTNTATVKAASTAAVAADKAVVVTQSPNNTVGVTGTFWQATQPVSGTFWQATQPVSLATNTPDVTDRSARLLGHVTVDNASLAVTGTFWQATQPVSGTVTANAGTNLNTSALALDATLTGGTQTTRLTDGTNTATVKAASTAPAAADKALVVVQSPNGYIASVARLVSAAATTNATLVKNAAGRVFKIRGYNAKAAVCYLKLYNKATAPTPASDNALLMASFALKASDVFDIDFTPQGYGFSTGIGFALTGASSDTDATALVAADIVGLNIFYA